MPILGIRRIPNPFLEIEKDTGDPSYEIIRKLNKVRELEKENAELKKEIEELKEQLAECKSKLFKWKGLIEVVEVSGLTVEEVKEAIMLKLMKNMKVEDDEGDRLDIWY